MGANKPSMQKPEVKTVKAPGFFIIISALLITVLFRNLIFIHETRLPKLSPKERRLLDKRLREFDESEQYALIAIADGWYPCLHSGRTSYYLKKGEVWKYGVTRKGKKGRYEEVFYAENGVDYLVQETGTISECLKAEQIRLFYYPRLPENLARPSTERLPLPPYNSKKQ